MMNIRFFNKHFDNQQLRPWLSICLSFLLLLSCITPPLTSIKDSPSPISASQVAEKKRQLRLSKPTTALTSVTPQSFQLKGEDEVHFDLPLSLPIIGSGIKTGSGALELSNRPPDGWHPSGLVTASASVSRSPNGDLNLSFEAGKYSGATTFYINASTVIPGNLAVKKGETITGNVDPNARYTISNDNGTAPLRYYAFDSGSLSATVNEDNVSVKLSGVTASKLTQVQCFSWGTGSSCDTSTDPNNKILSGEIEFIIPVTTSSLGLKLSATQDLIGNNTASESGNITTQSEISLDSLGSLKDWRIEIKKEGSESTGSPGAPAMCMTHAIVGGSGKKDKAATLDANSLGNGTYQVTAYYVDHPEEKAELTVEVDNMAELRIIGKTEFTPSEEVVEIQATYPACDSGKVELSGSTSQDFGLDDGSLSQCSLPLLEKPSGGTVSTETGTWNGICGDARGVYTWAADLFVGESLEDTQNLECLTCGENGPPLNPEETRDLIDDITEQGSPAFNDLKNYDNSINQVNSLSNSLQGEGISVPGIGNSGFQTQSTTDAPPLSNRAQRLYTKYLEAFQQYQTYKSSLLSEASGFTQTYGDYLQNQKLIDYAAVEAQYHPEYIDEYRDEILQRLLETKDNLSLNTHSLASATQSYAELVQLYVYLSKDHFDEKFIGIDLANSNWEPYDPSLEDEPEVIALEKIRNSSHLMRFTSRKINKIAGKLIARQGKIEEKTQPLFDDLGITPSEFTTEYFNNVRQLALEATVEADEALQNFINELPSEGFSIQAENSISAAIKQKANAAIKKLIS